MQSARAGFPPVSRLTLAKFCSNYVSRFRVARLDTREWARHMLDTDAFQVEGTLVGLTRVLLFVLLVWALLAVTV